MTTHQKCVGLFGWLFGHRMESNFDRSQHEMMEKVRMGIPITIIEANEMLGSLSGNSICRRCGMVVEKKDKRDMV